MSRFFRDDDWEHFDAAADVTAGEQHGVHRLESASPTKRSKDVGSNAVDQDAALASLRKRMAGPSSAKAGLGQNIDEINRRIYEASKGSKFFENEKDRDEKTTRRIEKMLKKRDEQLRLIPPGSEAWKMHEKKIDERAVQLETSRDLSRVILHADMDMFYAAVELKRDPSLKGKAFGVGKGVLVTASYEARKFGVRSGMASHVALKLCPDLIIVKNEMQDYVAASKEVMTVFETYDPTYAQMSLDEAYLDVTPYCEMNKADVEEVVKQLRQEVERKTGLTVSVGIAPNKMLAKISSDRNKPNGQFRVLPDRQFIISLMQDLPCRKIPGIGRVTERILSSLDVETCGDIWTSRVLLDLVMNDMDWLLNAYLGIHSNVVEPAKREERKSVGREHTFQPTSNLTAIRELLKESAIQLGKDLERLEFRGKTVTLTCKTDRFQRFTRAKTLIQYQYKADEIFAIASKLLDAEIVARGGAFPLRLIGVRVTNLKDMREPGKGSLKGMFARNNSTSPQKKMKMTADTLFNEDDDHYEEEEEDDEEDLYAREMKKAVEESIAELEGHSKVEKVSLQYERKKAATVNCPICQRAIEVRGAPEQHNVILNQHIDQCLQGEVRAMSPPLKTGHSNNGKRKVRTLDSFVLKKV